MCDTAWHEPLSGGVRGGLELEVVIWWARRGETYCVLVATLMAMPQRPVALEIDGSLLNTHLVYFSRHGSE